MGMIHQPPKPKPALSADSRLKMHLRVLPLGGCTYRVVTPRPGTRIAFSTNFYHLTWHLVTSQRGARLLARLFWGLSFQRQPNTLLLVHGSHLLPTPFEAERSDPFLIVPSGLTRLDPAALRTLKRRLDRLGPPTRTIRWHTFGLDLALDGRTRNEDEWLRREEGGDLWRQERMERRGGFICYSAPPPILRYQALRVHALRVRRGNCLSEMDYHYLAESTGISRWYGGGEVQVFADYMDRVAAATQARHELLPYPNQPITSETVQEVVSRHRDRIKARRFASVSVTRS